MARKKQQQQPFFNVTEDDVIVAEEHRTWQRRYRRPTGILTDEQARQFAEYHLYSDHGPTGSILANLVLELLEAKEI